jgi:hypothetical protein
MDRIELLPGRLAPHGHIFVRQRVDGKLTLKKLLYKIGPNGKPTGDPIPFKKPPKQKSYPRKRQEGTPRPCDLVMRDEKTGHFQPGVLQAAHDPAHLEKRRIGIKRRHAWNRSFRQFFTPAKMLDVMASLYETAINPEDPQKVSAIKEILNRGMGKPKTLIDINENQTLTIEERKVRVLSLLGVSPNDATLRFRDGTPAFQSAGDDGNGAAALPAALPALPEPLPNLGEVAPGGDNVGERPEVRGEADNEDEKT